MAELALQCTKNNTKLFTNANKMRQFLSQCSGMSLEMSMELELGSATYPNEPREPTNSF